MIGVPLALGRAESTAKRRLRGAAAALLVSGVFAGGLGLLGVTPTGALGTTWFAYADGGATSPLGCARTNVVSGQCTLAQALRLAPTGDIVVLATPGSVGHYTGNFSIGADLSLQPASGVVSPVLDGGGASGSVLTVGRGVTASVTGVTVTGGTNSTGGLGGGVNNSGTLTLSDVTVSGNSVVSVEQPHGGGIYNQGTITVDDSTVSGNNVTGTGTVGFATGGGMYSTGTAVVADSTFSGNTTTGPAAAGSGIYSVTDITIEDSTVVHNSANSPGPVSGTGVVSTTSATLAGTIVAQNSCSGPIVDGGYNIDDSGTCGLHATGSVSNSSAVDSYLGTLSDNGGPTETIPLLAAPTAPVGPDPALNVIPSSFTLPSGGPAVCSVPDQRGASRSAPCDMGAYETHPANEATTTQPVGPSTTVVPGGSVTSPASVTPATDDDTGSYPVGVGGAVAPTTTSLTDSNTAPAPGGHVTYTAMVSPMPDDAGSVAFSDNGTPVTCGAGSTGLTNGVATCNVTYTAAGSHTVIATYSGDTTFGPSVSNTTSRAVAIGAG